MTPKLQQTMVYLSGAARFAMTEYTSGHVWSRLAFKFITFQTVIVCPNNWIVIFAYLIISANHSYYNQSFQPRMHTYHRNLRAPPKATPPPENKAFFWTMMVFRPLRPIFLEGLKRGTLRFPLSYIVPGGMKPNHLLKAFHPKPVTQQAIHHSGGIASNFRDALPRLSMHQTNTLTCRPKEKK